MEMSYRVDFARARTAAARAAGRVPSPTLAIWPRWSMSPLLCVAVIGFAVQLPSVVSFMALDRATKYYMS